jgi:hypothetical protein
MRRTARKQYAPPASNFESLQLRGVLVRIGGADDVDDGGAGDKANVTHRFQPSGLFS